MVDNVPDLPEFAPGSVWLVGAGPGDPGLLTLHALHALKHADYIIHDALVSHQVLDIAGPDATREYAGKRGGKPSPRQVDISRRLIKLARQGHRVLRLKGGDPFVFGRGVEEALSLVAANIPFRVVPGISSGVGGLAYAGIPLTFRESNSAVTFVTAHAAGGAVPDGVNWRAVAGLTGTIVVYMPLKNLADITDQLIAGGVAADAPAAIVSNATLPNQYVLETNLSSAARAAADAGMPPPALLVIGDAVRLRAGLDWIGAMAGRQLEPDPLGVGIRDETG